LIRIASLFANIAQANKPSENYDCFEMASVQSAKLLRRDDYGIAVGNPADIIIYNAAAPEIGLKRGRHTFTRPAAELHRPH